MSSSKSGKVIATVIVALVVVGVSLATVVDMRLPATSGQDHVESIGFMLAFVACALTGAVILARQPRHTIGWLLTAVGLIPVVAVPLEHRGTYVMLRHGEPDAATVLGFWLNSWYWYLLIGLVIIYLPLLFPTGRLPSPRWRTPAAVPTVSLALMVVIGMLHPTIGSQEERSIVIPNPTGIEGMQHVEDSLVGSVLFVGMLAGMFLAVAAVVVRFRRSAGVERQQMKWFLLPAALLPLGALVDLFPLPEVILALAMPLTVAAFPVAIGIAITRYRLYDLGRLVSRTLTYAVVIAVLIGVYAGSVLALSTLVRSLTGESSDLVVAVSTLVVAGAFQPVRRRVQTVVDRRFNRSRYDAARTVEAFGAHLRDELELASLSAELRTVTSRTLHPASVGLWIRGEQA